MVLLEMDSPVAMEGGGNLSVLTCTNYTDENSTLRQDCGVCDYRYPDTAEYCHKSPYSLGQDASSWSPYMDVTYGFVSPLLVVITIVTNTLVSVVLLKKNMRSPTNMLLVAMAQSDLFTGLPPVPSFIYFFTMDNYVDWVPYAWCYTYDLMFEIIPTICHTASIWLTVALALQRYIYVCHSLKAKQWCTMINVLKIVIGIYVAAILSQVTKFFEYQYEQVEVFSNVDPSVMMTSCIRDLSPFVKGHMNLYFNLYYWFRVIFIHLVPCTSLLVLNGLLISAMTRAQRRREQLLRQNRRSECRRLKESNCTTLMLVAVVGLFLLVEFPLAIFFILLIVENTFDLHLVPDTQRATASLFINLCILLSYPLNFFIYCGMSRQFRETFKRLFVSGSAPLERGEQSQYISLATENGGGKTEYDNTTNHSTKDTAI